VSFTVECADTVTMLIVASDIESKPVCTVIPAAQSDVMHASDSDVIQSHQLVSSISFDCVHVECQSVTVLEFCVTVVLCHHVFTLGM